MPRSTKQLPSIRDRLMAQQRAVNERPASVEDLAAAAEASFHAIPRGLLIPIERIDTWERQPRKEFPDAAIDELAASIAASGLLEPLVVRREPAEPGRYLIVAGHRRLLALRRLYGSDDPQVRAQVAEVPCIVRDLTDDVAFANALVENLIRSDLTRKEVIDALASLQDEFGWSGKEIARRTGRSASDVNDMLRVAHDEALYPLIVEDKIAPAVATRLYRLPEKERDHMLTRVRGGGRITMQTVDRAIAARRLTSTAQPTSAPLEAPAADHSHYDRPTSVSSMPTHDANERPTPVDSKASDVSNDRPTSVNSTPTDEGVPEAPRSRDIAKGPTREVLVGAHMRRIPLDKGAQAAVELMVEGLMRDVITTLSPDLVVGPATLGKIREMIDHATAFVKARDGQDAV